MMRALCWRSRPLLSGLSRTPRTAACTRTSSTPRLTARRWRSTSTCRQAFGRPLARVGARRSLELGNRRSRRGLRADRLRPCQLDFRQSSRRGFRRRFTTSRPRLVSPRQARAYATAPTPSRSLGRPPAVTLRRSSASPTARGARGGARNTWACPPGSPAIIGYYGASNLRRSSPNRRRLA